MPHLLWHRASVYNGHLRGLVTSQDERLAVELPLPVYTTYICRGWNSNIQPSACAANVLTHCATPAVKNQQQTMKNNIGTQHKNVHSWYTGSLYNSQIPHFNCIMVSQVSMNHMMEWSMSLNPAIFRDEQKRYVRVALSFKKRPHGRKMLQC